MVDDHLRCYRELDWGEVKTKVRVVCDAQSIQKNELGELRRNTKEDLEKLDDKIGRGLIDRTTEIKDCRKSITTDLNTFNLLTQKTYVTKAEFLASNRAVYLAVTLIILEAVKRYLT
jgi:hypothetical protein